MAYESYYPGSVSSLDSHYGDEFTQYRIPVSELGATTSIQTANQVKEVTNLLNQGVKAIELATIKPEAFEMISDENLKEINRITKLTGANTSLHAPMVDPSGFTEQGWDETNREIVENQFVKIADRAQKISPDGNIPVTIHSSSVPGSEQIEIKDPETGKMKEVTQRMVAVNRDTGQLIPLQREERFYPGREEGKTYTPEEELEIANESYWDNKLSQLFFYKDRADEILTRAYPKFAGEKPENFEEIQKHAFMASENAGIYLKNTHQSVNSLFNEAFKVADQKGQEQLRKAAERFEKDLKKSYIRDNQGQLVGTNPSYYSAALGNLINSMKVVTEEHTPQIYAPVEDFVNQKASDTFSNVALKTYKKFKDKAPIISIENPPYGSAVSRAEDLKRLVEESRKKFVKKAVKDGMSKSDAEQAAEKMIGATWDTSHISMLRKQGFKPEKLVKEAETIAPFVKHVHLNDNFGFTHTDLPPGWGDVPIKEVMEKFDEAGVKAQKIFEGGAFFGQYQTSPFPYVLEAFGHQTGIKGDYFAGYGTIFPEQHFSMYGSGLSGLPTELGGQIPGKQSRFSGTPVD